MNKDKTPPNGGVFVIKNIFIMTKINPKAEIFILARLHFVLGLWYNYIRNQGNINLDKNGGKEK
ncbi:MAG TPA: hypothetical protein PLM59_02420 [Oscillospiraceae bacterium]|nr:hypothetical protein [Oscillospiraceae bacterium]